MGTLWSISCSETRKREALTFLIVHNLTLVVFLHFQMVDSGVTNVTPDGGIRDTFIGNGLKESRATRPGTSEDQAHFTRFQKSRVSEGWKMNKSRRQSTNGQTYL
jgi:hypothetical protein